jgi:phospholipase A1/A2
MRMKHICRWAFAVTVLVVFSARADETLSSQQSPLDIRLNEQKSNRSSVWAIEPYRPNYVIPVSYIEDPSKNLEGTTPSEEDKFQEIEVKFQISFRLAVADNLFWGNGDIFFAYTQVSVWQAYNSANSSPFRDTNYEPEMFVSFDTDYDVLGLHGSLLSLGAVHQSNGRGSDDLSRSWNRLYANIVMERGNFVCSVKPWWRFPENEEEDNNPGIENYLGYGEFRAAYKWKQHTFATLLRDNLKVDENHGAIELDWSFPLHKQIKGYVQYFYGYGETLLDYNEIDQRIGVGFLLADWI